MVDIQRELLVDTSTILENDIGCSDIVNAIIKRDAEECVLFRQRDAHALNTEYWASAETQLYWRRQLTFHKYSTRGFTSTGFLGA